MGDDLFPPVVETDRLRLSRLTFDAVDLYRLYEICSADPAIDEVTEHVTWEPHPTPAATREFVADATAAWDAGERATYVVRPREGEDGAGDVAGVTELHAEWDRRRARLGVWFRKRFWGRGYSGERAAALMDVAFDVLDLDLIVVRHFAGNEQSRRAIERYVEAHGGRHEGRLRNEYAGDDGPRDVHRYSVSREEWAATERTTASFRW
ncbi:MAG: GNAT family N-acetyltransferase [Haloferacaceae archaeon]